MRLLPAAALALGLFLSACNSLPEAEIQALVKDIVAAEAVHKSFDAAEAADAAADAAADTTDAAAESLAALSYYVQPVFHGDWKGTANIEANEANANKAQIEYENSYAAAEEISNAAYAANAEAWRAVTTLEARKAVVKALDAADVAAEAEAAWEAKTKALDAADAAIKALDAAPSLKITLQLKSLEPNIKALRASAEAWRASAEAWRANAEAWTAEFGSLYRYHQGEAKPPG